MTIVIGNRLHSIIVVYSCTMHSCMVQSVCKEHATLQIHLVAAVQLSIQLIHCKQICFTTIHGSSLRIIKLHI